LDLRTIPVIESTTKPAQSPETSISSPSDIASRDEKNIIKVMTLNMAHARNDGFHQIFQSADTARDNLDTIRSLINTRKPDIVALQEVDRPSFWSGSIDHVDYIARGTSFTHYINGVHARGFNLSYGTALLSNTTLTQPLTVTFKPDHSITPKGFLISTSRLADTSGSDIEVDIVSVHLEIFNQNIRQKQAIDLVRELRTRNRPLIIMGDFNTEWHQSDAVIKYIVYELGLQTFEPDSTELATFPFFEKRFDWILASSHFTFTSYKVLSEKVSDHKAVLATLRLITEKSM
ncbi:MAG: endonuclease/exonuclease/phosphatase family protein, partial [Gammaproteobacteria bacterium]|nr:endonuclease/exonuclease/phosphatase family protein [Gammaproteobacteria bacterium]